MHAVCKFCGTSILSRPFIYENNAYCNILCCKYWFDKYKYSITPSVQRKVRQAVHDYINYKEYYTFDNNARGVLDIYKTYGFEMMPKWSGTTVSHESVIATFN